MPFKISGLPYTATNQLPQPHPTVSPFPVNYISLGFKFPLSNLSLEHAKAFTIKRSVDRVMLAYYGDTAQFSNFHLIESQKSAFLQLMALFRLAEWDVWNNSVHFKRRLSLATFLIVPVGHYHSEFSFASLAFSGRRYSFYLHGWCIGCWWRPLFLVLSDRGST